MLTHRFFKNVQPGGQDMFPVISCDFLSTMLEMSNFGILPCSVFLFDTSLSLWVE